MKKPENKLVDLDRTEDKYILPREDFVKVKHDIETHLPPYFPEPETVYCINRSIYFDSPDLTFLKQHLQGLDNRRKIRIRCYAPNGIPNHIYYIEVKSKSNGKSTKTRLQLTEDAFNYTMKHNQIPVDENLLIANEDMEHDEILKEAKLINYLMLTNKVQPIVDVSYKRYAYQENESFRVTLDLNIKVKPLKIFKLNQIQDLKNQDLWDQLRKYGEKFSNVEDFLLESKYHSEQPDWFSKMIEDLDVEPKSFSKYVWSIYQVMNNTLKLVR